MTTEGKVMSDGTGGGPLGRLIRFCLENKLVVWLLVVAIVFWGALVAPFDWPAGDLPRDPVPVDAIPDYGENQQIVFTEWTGRSPQDVEDQITYPLTVSLLGVPGVKTVRSYSYFGFSSTYATNSSEAVSLKSRIGNTLLKTACSPTSSRFSGATSACRNRSKERFWMSIRLGISITLSMVEKDLRNRGALTEAPIHSSILGGSRFNSGRAAGIRTT